MIRVWVRIIELEVNSWHICTVKVKSVLPKYVHIIYLIKPSHYVFSDIINDISIFPGGFPDYNRSAANHGMS